MVQKRKPSGNKRRASGDKKVERNEAFNRGEKLEEETTGSSWQTRD